MPSRRWRCDWRLALMRTRSRGNCKTRMANVQSLIVQPNQALRDEALVVFDRTSATPAPCNHWQHWLRLSVFSAPFCH